MRESTVWLVSDPANRGIGCRQFTAGYGRFAAAEAKWEDSGR